MKIGLDWMAVRPKTLQKLMEISKKIMKIWQEHPEVRDYPEQTYNMFIAGVKVATLMKFDMGISERSLYDHLSTIQDILAQWEY